MSCVGRRQGCIVVAGNWTPLPCRRVTAVPSPYHTHSRSHLARDVEAPEAGGHSLRALKVSLREQVTCGPAPFPLLPGPCQPHWQPKAAASWGSSPFPELGPAWCVAGDACPPGSAQLPVQDSQWLIIGRL